MSVPHVFKLDQVSILLQVWHQTFIHVLLPVKVLSCRAFV